MIQVLLCTTWFSGKANLREHNGDDLTFTSELSNPESELYSEYVTMVKDKVRNTLFSLKSDWKLEYKFHSILEI